MILDSFAKYILFGTDVFGHYTMGKGLLSMYAVMLPTFGIAALYVYYFHAGNEKTYCLVWSYKLQMIMLITAMVCYSFDGLLFIFNKKMFCTLQTEKPTLKCDERNKYFLLYVTIFWVFWAPLWYACNLSILRYSRRFHEESSERMGLYKLERRIISTSARNVGLPGA